MKNIKELFFLSYIFRISKLYLTLFLILLLSNVNLFTQDKTTEVLYFKAKLACCKARACDALQDDVDSLLKKYFAKEKIDFKVIPLIDEANKDLVAKYNAKSQTVIIITKTKQQETSMDVSEIVQEYARSRNKIKFEEDMKAKITLAINNGEITK